MIRTGDPGRPHSADLPRELGGFVVISFLICLLPPLLQEAALTLPSLLSLPPLLLCRQTLTHASSLVLDHEVADPEVSGSRLCSLFSQFARLTPHPRALHGRQHRGHSRGRDDGGCPRRSRHLGSRPAHQPGSPSFTPAAPFPSHSPQPLMGHWRPVSQLLPGLFLTFAFPLGAKKRAGGGGPSPSQLSLPLGVGAAVAGETWEAVAAATGPPLTTLMPPGGGGVGYRGGLLHFPALLCLANSGGDPANVTTALACLPWGRSKGPALHPPGTPAVCGDS